MPDTENDRFDGTIRLLELLAIGLRFGGLDYIASTVEANMQGIAIDLTVTAERNPVTTAVLDAMILAAVDGHNAH